VLAGLMSGAVARGSGVVGGSTRGNSSTVKAVLGRTKRRLRQGLTLSVPGKESAEPIRDKKELEVSSWDANEADHDQDRRRAAVNEKWALEVSEGDKRKYWTVVKRGRKRKQCEDLHRAVPDFRGVREASSSFFGVFDGHGGLHAAKFAADNLFEFFRQSQKFTEGAVEEAFVQAFEETDVNLRAIHEADLGPSTGTTAVAVYLTDCTLSVAHVGDSRAVLASRGRATCLSRDHTAEHEDEYRRVEENGGYILRKRVNGALAITRSIGDRDYKKFVIATPEVYTRRLEDGDDLLILATDGLWDALSPEQAVQACLSHMHDLEKACTQLINDALVGESADDIGVTIINLRELPHRGLRRPSDARFNGPFPPMRPLSGFNLSKQSSMRSGSRASSNGEEEERLSK